MEEIDSFVRKLCAEGDLRLLTKKLIRTQYQAHCQKDSVTREEKDKINQVLETVVQELADQAKDLPAQQQQQQQHAAGGNLLSANSSDSSPLGQGKENVCGERLSPSDAPAPAPFTPPKKVVARKMVRSELGGTFSGHSHLRRIQLMMNAGGQRGGRRSPKSKNTSLTGARPTEEGRLSPSQSPFLSGEVNANRDQASSRTLLSAVECGDGSGDPVEKTACDSIRGGQEGTRSVHAETNGEVVTLTDIPAEGSLVGKEMKKTRIIAVGDAEKTHAEGESSEDKVLSVPHKNAHTCDSEAEGKRFQQKSSRNREEKVSASCRDKAHAAKASRRHTELPVMAVSSSKARQRVTKTISLQDVVSAVTQSPPAKSHHPDGASDHHQSFSDADDSPGYVKNVSKPSKPSSSSRSRALFSPEDSKDLRSKDPFATVTDSSSDFFARGEESQDLSSPLTQPAGKGHTSTDRDRFTRLKIKSHATNESGSAKKRVVDLSRKSASSEKPSSVPSSAPVCPQEKGFEDFSSPMAHPTEKWHTDPEHEHLTKYSHKKSRVRCDCKERTSGSSQKANSEALVFASCTHVGQTESRGEGDSSQSQITRTGFSSSSFFKRRQRAAQQRASGPDTGRPSDVFVIDSDNVPDPCSPVICRIKIHTDLTQAPLPTVKASTRRRVTDQKKDRKNKGHKCFESDDEPLVVVKKSNKRKKENSSFESVSDNEPLSVVKKNNKKEKERSNCGSSSDDEVLSIVKESDKRKKNNSNIESDRADDSLSMSVVKKNYKKKKGNSNFESDSDDAPLRVVKKSGERKKENSDSESGSDNVPLSIVKKTDKKKIEIRDFHSDSDDAPLKGVKETDKGKKGNSNLLSDSDDEPLSMARKADSDTVSVEDEPWHAVPYRGEPLKYPVIKLNAVQVQPTANTSRLCDRKVRNIFDCFQLDVNFDRGESTPRKQNSQSDCTSPERVFNPPRPSLAPLKLKINTVACTDTLEESRSQLKTQQHVGNTSSKLCTKLTLRKQPSPQKSESSLEAEEWTVVTQDSDWTMEEAPQPKEDSDKATGENPPSKVYSDWATGEGLRSKDHCDWMTGKDPRSNEAELGGGRRLQQPSVSCKLLKKRKAAMADASSDDDKRPLKKKKMAAVSSDDNLQDPSPVKAKKSRKPKKQAWLESSDEDEAADLGAAGSNDESNDDVGSPLKRKKPFGGRKTKQTLKDSSDDEETLKPKSMKSRPRQKDGEKDHSSSEEDDKPLQVKPKSLKSQQTHKEKENYSSEKDDEPLKPKAVKSQQKQIVEEEENCSSDEDEEPLKPKSVKSHQTHKEKENDSSDEEDEPLKPKSVKSRQKQKIEEEEKNSSNEDVEPLKSTSVKSVKSRQRQKDEEEDNHSSDGDDGPLKPKSGKSRQRQKVQKAENYSSDEDEEPLKPKSVKSRQKQKVEKEDNFSSNEDVEPLKSTSVKSGKSRQRQKDEEEDNHSSDGDDGPLKPKSGKSRQRQKVQKAENYSSDEDDEPLKPKSVKSQQRQKDEEDQYSSDEADKPLKSTLVKSRQRRKDVEDDNYSSDEDDGPLKPKSGKSRKRQKLKEAENYSSDEDDEPLKPKSVKSPRRQKVKDSESDAASESEGPSNGEDLGDDFTPLKVKKPVGARRGVVSSSEEDDTNIKSPAKVISKTAKGKNVKTHQESDLDTSSLSSGGDNSAPPVVSKRPNVKFTKRKPQKNGKQEREDSDGSGDSDASPVMKGRGSKAASTTVKTSNSTDESGHLKKLRVICRKVGIFVRNDIHFVGCSSDNQKIKRLKEALKKAGMEGQPSLSKVDAVNLKREAAALDTTNIIETAGRPKRQPKDVFQRTDSPKKSLTPIKQQFSRIKDLISDSDSD